MPWSHRNLLFDSVFTIPQSFFSCIRASLQPSHKPPSVFQETQARGAAAIKPVVVSGLHRVVTRGAVDVEVEEGGGERGFREVEDGRAGGCGARCTRGDGGDAAVFKDDDGVIVETGAIVEAACSEDGGGLATWRASFGSIYYATTGDLWYPTHSQKSRKDGAQAL